VAAPESDVYKPFDIVCRRTVPSRNSSEAATRASRRIRLAAAAQRHGPVGRDRLSLAPPIWNAPITTLRTAMKMMAKKALQNCETVKPPTIDHNDSSIRGLSTSRKKLSVSKVNNSVRTTNSAHDRLAITPTYAIAGKYLTRDLSCPASVRPAQHWKDCPATARRDGFGR